MSYANYSAAAQPKNAPNDLDCSLRQKTKMNARKHAPVPRPLAALARINPSCDCKVTMVTSCIRDKQPGCEERRTDGICGCRPRWLPVCILDPETPHGCPDWSMGTTCSCDRMYMPRCLVTGCNERQKGKRCDSRFCTRTPVGICPHFQAELKRHEKLTPDDAAAIVGQIVRDLEIVKPRNYREPRLPSGPGVVARAGAAAMHLMSRRRKRKLGLWLPGDVRYLDDEEIKRNQERRLARGLKRLAQAVLLPANKARAS